MLASVDMDASDAFDEPPDADTELVPVWCSDCVVETCAPSRVAARRHASAMTECGRLAVAGCPTRRSMSSVDGMGDAS